MMTSSSNPRGQTVMVTSLIFMALATTFVVMRLFTRLVMLKNAGLDDLVICLSYICSIFLLIMTHEQVTRGMGKHFTEVSPTDFEDMLRYLWITISFYQASVWLTKISILLQYFRLFVVGKGIRRICIVLLAFIGAYGIYAVTSNIFMCTPVSGFWSPTPTTHCIAKKFLWFFNASFDIVSDLVILLLPMPIIKSLNLPMRQKVGLMLIFALGGFVCLVSVLRLRSLYIISVSEDPTYDNTGAAIWSNIETYTGIMCASLPAIKPIIARAFPRLLSSTRSKNATDTFNNNGFGTHHTIKGAPIRLDDIDKRQKTVTRVEASERRFDNMGQESSSDDLGKDIFVTTSMRLEVENKSEIGSEKDLIFHSP